MLIFKDTTPPDAPDQRHLTAIAEDDTEYTVIIAAGIIQLFRNGERVGGNYENEDAAIDVAAAEDRIKHPDPEPEPEPEADPTDE